MLIKNAKLFLGRSFTQADIQFDRTITAIGRLPGQGDLDAAGCYVIPGLVDIHTHGAVGEDFSDGKPQGLRPLADYYAAHGVTSFLATTMTLKEHQLTPAMEAIRDFRAEGTARCAGIHLEGPFLSYAKRGAQAAENLHKPDAALLHRLDGASGGLVRLVTVAPEEEGAMDFIREASKLCTVSLGHTTADYDTAMAAFAAAGDRPAAARRLASLLQSAAPIAPVCFKNYTVLTHPGVVEGLDPAPSFTFQGLESWRIRLEG